MNLYFCTNEVGHHGSRDSQSTISWQKTTVQNSLLKFNRQYLHLYPHNNADVKKTVSGDVRFGIFTDETLSATIRLPPVLAKPRARPYGTYTM